jgi:hypothetical protein
MMKGGGFLAVNDGSVYGDPVREPDYLEIMIGEAPRGAADQGNTPAKETSKMTEGKPSHRKSPAEGPGLWRDLHRLAPD